MPSVSDSNAGCCLLSVVHAELREADTITPFTLKVGRLRHGGAATRLEPRCVCPQPAPSATTLART